MGKPRTLIDTNVIIIGAKDLAEEKETPQSKIIKQAINEEIIIVMNTVLLKEYHKIATELEGKDFAGWFRNVIMKDLEVTYANESPMKNLIKEYNDQIPKEDLPHFTTSLLKNADYLISENREFLKRSKGYDFECITPQQYLEK